MGLWDRVGKVESSLSGEENVNIILKPEIVTPTLYLNEMSLSIPLSNLTRNNTYPIRYITVFGDLTRIDTIPSSSYSITKSDIVYNNDNNDENDTGDGIISTVYFEGSIKPSQISFTFDRPGCSIHLVGDKNLNLQFISNILYNSIRLTESTNSRRYESLPRIFNESDWTTYHQWKNSDIQPGSYLYRENRQLGLITDTGTIGGLFSSNLFQQATELAQWDVSYNQTRGNHIRQSNNNAQSSLIYREWAKDNYKNYYVCFHSIIETADRRSAGCYLRWNDPEHFYFIDVENLQWKNISKFIRWRYPPV